MSNAPSLSGRKLAHHRRIHGTMTCVTGLHIGAGKDDIEIGGTDNPIIRDPLTDLPYVPGSSLKGKLRAMVELRDGHYDPRSGEPGGDGRADCLICRVFGPHKNTRHSLGPTRIIVRDSFVSEESREQLKELQTERGLPFTEMKSENMIQRTTGVALNPRIQERIPAGTVFNFDISVRIFEGDDETAILRLIENGLALIQDDTFGASGSRGSGRVAFEYTVV